MSVAGTGTTPGGSAESGFRKVAKACVVALLGRECRPRRIMRGLARGYRICVSPAENLSYVVGTADPHLQKAIRKYVAAGDTVYDVGANMGYVSLLLSKRVGTGGQVVAFEPVPGNLRRLLANIENNGLSNIHVWSVAASDRNGEAVLRIAGNTAMASLVWHRANPSAAEIIVRTVAIDDLVRAGDLKEPRFVKMDIEGAEGLAMLGMRQTIEAAKPVVFIECSEAGRDTTWQLLRQLGYQCKRASTGKPVNAFPEYRHADFLWIPPNLGA